MARLILHLGSLWLGLPSACVQEARCFSRPVATDLGPALGGQSLADPFLYSIEQTSRLTSPGTNWDAPPQDSRPRD
ncbi:hypothetical protein FA13DRAFT_1750567 [Coprinellus micaceus]|uniref:Uncharacterized protein n=1 Tax=Coprinellus micaceus TaxID=71717 RepID=A0A4Y7R786_COPMI|nr:hypothetical protein FA13DRAFT_1750567 [Coprinellus micaceus]